MFLEIRSVVSPGLLCTERRRFIGLCEATFEAVIFPGSVISVLSARRDGGGISVKLLQSVVVLIVELSQLVLVHC